MNSTASTIGKVVSFVLVIALVAGIGIWPLVDMFVSGEAFAEPGPGMQSAAGMIRVGDQEIQLADIDKARNAERIEGGALPKMESMEQLLKYFKDLGMLNERRYDFGFKGMDDLMDGMASGMAPQATAAPEMAPAPDMDMANDAPMAPAEDPNYSDTNSQVEGVAEGDIVVTDGKNLYIYRQSDNSVQIVSVNGAKMTTLGRIYPGKGAGKEKADQWISEMYIQNGFLVTVGSRYEYMESQPYTNGREVACCYIFPSRNFTVYTVYDVRNAEKPVETRCFEVEGSALSTRMIGNTLYFVSNRWIYDLPLEDMGDGDILPIYRDTVTAQHYVTVPVEDIYYFPENRETSYLFVGAMEIDSETPVKMNSYIGAGNNIYMSHDSLYVVGYDTTNYNNQKLTRFAINGTEIVFVAEGTVNGNLINQYALDEYKGYLRVATTDWSSGGNFVTVFDAATMEQVGQTPALAKGESIQSVRFTGDVGYVVTFLQIDPLFVLDLSDPTRPTVKGELKIPGFSTYLHPIGDGLVVGFGRDVVETYADINGRRETVGTMDIGMKISLFDVSDPTRPREIDTLSLGRDSYSETLYNPKSMMVDAKRGYFGFDLAQWGSEYWSGVLLLRVENGRLEEMTRFTMLEQHYNSRVKYVGDTLYVVTEHLITAYDYSTFEELATLKIW